MHPTRANILICQDEKTAAAEAAGRFACAALSSVAQRDQSYVAVPGGWSPRGMYEMLAADEFRAIVPWAKTHLFFTDERCVPPDSEESNYRLVNDLLISPVGLPDTNVHRFKGELDPETAAAGYEDELRRAMGESPRFDLVVLGMGRDTHTASLFPILLRSRSGGAWRPHITSASSTTTGSRSLCPCSAAPAAS